MVNGKTDIIHQISSKFKMTFNNMHMHKTAQISSDAYDLLKPETIELTASEETAIKSYCDEIKISLLRGKKL